MPLITDIVVVCVRNIAQAISDDPKYLQESPKLLNYLMFLNFRILVPFMENNQSLAEPQARLKSKTYIMDKNFSGILFDYYSVISQGEYKKYYLKYFYN
jgi:hypothetical protein